MTQQTTAPMSIVEFREWTRLVRPEGDISVTVHVGDDSYPYAGTTGKVLKMLWQIKGARVSIQG